MPAKKPKKVTRQALIVLGMHRSGTSAVSGVLAKLGVQAPKSLMSPTPANPRGYWESVALMGFHDRILESAGTDWSDWGKFNESWIDSSEAEDFQRDLSTLLDEEYGNNRLFLVKDPRMCRLLPFWIKALRNLDIAPKVVITVRHPDEVTMSLEARDHFGKNQSRLIWLRNMLDAESSSRVIPRVFIRYSDLLRDWRSQMHRIASQLDIKWPRWSGSVEADIDAYLTPELRHHVSPEPALSPSTDAASWAAESCRALDSVIDGDGRSEILQILDKTRKDFDRTSTIYAPVVHEHRSQYIQKEKALVENLAASSTENDHLKETLAKLSEDYQAREASLEAMASQQNFLNADLARQKELESRQRVEMDAVKERLRSRDLEYADLESRYRTELADAARQTQAIQAELADRLQRRESDYAELESRYSAKLAELESIHHDTVAKLHDEINAQKVESLASQQTISDQHRAELAELESMHHDTVAKLHDEINALKVENLASQQTISDQHRAELAELESMHLGTVYKLREEINALKVENWTAQQTISSRFTEVAKLSSLVLELEDRVTALQDKAGQLNADLLDEKRISLAKNTRILALEETTEEYESKFLVLEQELDAKSALIHDYKSRLEQIHSNKIWKIGTMLGRIAGRGKAPAMVDKEESDIDILRHSGLFDVSWYLRKYPDVRASGIDPILHYLKHGAKEGHDPSPVFSTHAYKARHPDVAAAGVNPLVHYIKYGRQEGRGFSTKIEIGNGQSKPATDN